MLLPHLLEPQSSGRRPTLRMLRANTSLYSAGLRRCARRFSGTVSPETMNSSRSSGRIRMEVTTQTYGSSPRSQSAYTAALDTPRCSATSRTRSSRFRPPQYDTRSAVVGVVRTRGAVPGATWARPGTSSLATPKRGALLDAYLDSKLLKVGAAHEE